MSPPEYVATASTVKVSPAPTILVGVRLKRPGARIHRSSVPVTRWVSVCTCEYRSLAARKLSGPRITSPDCGYSAMKSGCCSSPRVSKSLGMACMYRSTMSRPDGFMVSPPFGSGDDLVVILESRREEDIVEYSYLF